MKHAFTLSFFLAFLPAAAAEDAALEPVPPQFDPGPEYADKARVFQGIPGLERAQNGRLWVTWYAGGPGEGPENYVTLVTSGDDGRSWSKIQFVIDPPGDVRAFDPCLWTDPAGRMWLFWAQGFSHYDGRAGVWCIVTENPGDEKPAWSEPRRISDGIMMNKPTVLADGTWMLPVAIWAAGPNKHLPPEKSFDDPERRGSRVICSRDGGKKFEFVGMAQLKEAACDEHMIVQRKDGSLWMLIRTRYGIGQSFSDDGGATWSAGEKYFVEHPTARFFIRRLKSGHLLLVKHGPIDRRTARTDLRAYVSEDDGKSWKGGLLLDSRQPVSYPDGVEAEDGTIYIVYDFSRTGEKEILLATFTEADAAAAKAVSDKVRLRIIANKATGVPAKNR